MHEGKDPRLLPCNEIQCALRIGTNVNDITLFQNVSARERFMRYRGLESFRTSQWDPKENLPEDYARIFQFQNYDRTRKRVFKELEDNLENMVRGTSFYPMCTGSPGFRGPQKYLQRT